MKVTYVSGKEMLTDLNWKGEQPTSDPDVYARVESNDVVIYYKQTEIFLQDVNVVFLVMKNADFTEGRGPMTFDKAFYFFDEAVKYVLSQPGIFGSKQGVHNRPGVSIKGTPYVTSGFNGFEIKPVEVQ